MTYGGVFADGDGILKATTYTLVYEYIWDGADYTVIGYDYDMPDENGELIELDDYHVNRTSAPQCRCAEGLLLFAEYSTKIYNILQNL